MERMALNFRSTPAHAILMMLASWIHREQDAVVAYQKEEIRALREMLGGNRLRFTDAQRRRQPAYLTTKLVLLQRAFLAGFAELRSCGESRSESGPPGFWPLTPSASPSSTPMTPGTIGVDAVVEAVKMKGVRLVVTIEYRHRSTRHADPQTRPGSRVAAGRRRDADPAH